jgi:thiol-disulfide isomerase/thioredoxin
MSETMQEKKRSLFPSMKLVAIAAGAGLIAGAVAVYLKEAAKGNGQEQTVAVDCAPAKATVARLAPFARGDVAAFIVNKDPQALSLPAFKTATGKDARLEDFSGKVQLVNLWATWCVPCREEMPALNGLQKALGGERFQVTAINLDTGSDEKPKEFLEETKIDALPLYHDATLSSFNALKAAGVAFGLPASVLLDGKGCMLGSLNGPAAWESDDAQALIKAAMGEGA